MIISKKLKKAPFPQSRIVPDFYVLYTISLLLSVLLPGCAFVIHDRTPLSTHRLAVQAGPPIQARIGVVVTPVISQRPCRDVVNGWVQFLRTHHVFDEVQYSLQIEHPASFVMEVEMTCADQWHSLRNCLMSVIGGLGFGIPALLPIYDYDFSMAATVTIHRGDLAKRYVATSPFDADMNLLGLYDGRKYEELFQRAADRLYEQLANDIWNDRAWFEEQPPS